MPVRAGRPVSRSARILYRGFSGRWFPAGTIMENFPVGMTRKRQRETLPALKYQLITNLYDGKTDELSLDKSEHRIV
jgi:hypothetical protein